MTPAIAIWIWIGIGVITAPYIYGRLFAYFQHGCPSIIAERHYKSDKNFSLLIAGISITLGPASLIPLALACGLSRDVKFK